MISIDVHIAVSINVFYTSFARSRRFDMRRDGRRIIVEEGLSGRGMARGTAGAPNLVVSATWHVVFVESAHN